MYVYTCMYECIDKVCAHILAHTYIYTLSDSGSKATRHRAFSVPGRYVHSAYTYTHSDSRSKATRHRAFSVHGRYVHTAYTYTHSDSRSKATRHRAFSVSVRYALMHILTHACRYTKIQAERAHFHHNNSALSLGAVLSHIHTCTQIHYATRENIQISPTHTFCHSRE
jgi:hypothetical protein